MFWTDWGSSPKIEKSALNGTKRFAIVTTNLTRPYGITLDRRNKLVFWVDNGMDVIESVEYSGSNRKLLFQRRGMFFWGVTFTSSYLFINEWRKSWVSQMDAYNGTIVNNITTGGIFPSGLIAFDSSLQRKMSRYFQFLCSFNERKTRKWFTKLVTAVYGVKTMFRHQSRLEGSKTWPTSTADCFI